MMAENIRACVSASAFGTTASGVTTFPKHFLHFGDMQLLGADHAPGVFLKRYTLALDDAQ